MKNTELEREIMIKSISLSKVVAHPKNANVMSGETFRKLVRNIERTGRYEPVVVRPHPKKKDCFEIINGHHRIKALEQLGYKQVDCVVWDVDDKETEILLTTLNRLCGRGKLSKRIALLNGLKRRMGTVKLAKFLPVTAKQIERLTNLRMPSVPANPVMNNFASVMVFFVTDQQRTVIEKGIERAVGDYFVPMTDIGTRNDKMTKAQRRAAAVTAIARRFLESVQRREEVG